ncbi:MAG: hypothetical protein ABR569_02170 [Gaiellaceae bacterium]
MTLSADPGSPGEGWRLAGPDERGDPVAALPEIGAVDVVAADPVCCCAVEPDVWTKEGAEGTELVVAGSDGTAATGAVETVAVGGAETVTVGTDETVGVCTDETVGVGNADTVAVVTAGTVTTAVTAGTATVGTIGTGRPSATALPAQVPSASSENKMARRRLTIPQLPSNRLGYGVTSASGP